LPDNVEEHKQGGKQLAGQEWEDATQKTKHMWTIMAYLIHSKWSWNTTPVEFVRFDEELYQCLVLYNCAVSRVVKGQKVRDQVSLDKATLHQFF
jgi:hypothetical protein